MVNNRINGDGRLTRLAVADNQLALSTADRNHGIYRLDTRLQRLVHRLAVDNTRSFTLERHLARLADDFAFPVKRIAQWVDDAANHAFAHSDGSDTARASHGVAFFDLVGRSQEDGTHVIDFQVHYDSFHAIVEAQQLAGLSIIQTIDAGYAVAHLEHGAYFLQFGIRADTLQLFAQDGGNFTYIYLICHTSLSLIVSHNFYLYADVNFALWDARNFLRYRFSNWFRILRNCEA